MSKLFISIVFLVLVLSTNAQNLQTADRLNEKGLDHAKKGQLDTAITEFTQAIDIVSRFGSTKDSARDGYTSNLTAADEAANVRVLDPNA